MRIFYLLGCIAVIVSWWVAIKNDAKEGKVDVTVGNALNLLCLTICSWLGFAKVVLSCKKEWFDKVIYTFNGEDYEKDLPRDPD